jgi:hypothetical protein
MAAAASPPLHFGPHLDPLTWIEFQPSKSRLICAAVGSIQGDETNSLCFCTAAWLLFYSLGLDWFGLRHNDAIIRHLKAGDALIFNDHVLHGSAARLNPGAWDHLI